MTCSTDRLHISHRWDRNCTGCLPSPCGEPTAFCIPPSPLPNPAPLHSAPAGLAPVWHIIDSLIMRTDVWAPAWHGVNLAERLITASVRWPVTQNENAGCAPDPKRPRETTQQLAQLRVFSYPRGRQRGRWTLRERGFARWDAVRGDGRDFFRARRHCDFCEWHTNPSGTFPYGNCSTCVRWHHHAKHLYWTFCSWTRTLKL